MSYAPQIQPPPPTGNPEFDLWMKRTVETLQEFMVRTRDLGSGLQFDARDRLEVGLGFMFRNKV